MKSLVIVESPTKAKTIRKFLPKNYVVDSSMGHIRDLPASAKEIPAKYKKEKWSNLGINVDKDFEPLYVVSAQKKKVVDRLKKELKEADELILATDEDREGEGISWHLLEVLKPKVPIKRMVFHEITQEAIQDALENFRSVDMNLVNAQEARRIIDRLAGYTISPLLWKKIAPGLSAGRVQSVAVELLVQRERDRIRFKGGSYWDIEAQLSGNGKSSAFKAALFSVDGKRIANGKDFDPDTGKLKNPASVVLLDKPQAEAFTTTLEKGNWTIQTVEKNRQKRSPAPPFITSTLQQEANRKFGYSAKDTMRIAQTLYENGFITYMRTDSTNLSKQALAAARTAVEDIYGHDYLSAKVRVYSKKAKGAQEAHEAIRPAGSVFKTPQETGLSGRDFKLYDLIWKRTMATQMAEAELEFTNVEIEALPKGTGQSLIFKASGKTIIFPGYYRAYVEGSDDPDAALENQESALPELKEAQSVKALEVDAKPHETKPPARFTEASLVKALEKEGVGRPSTYASIISTIIDRGYVSKDGNALVPSLTAFAVTGLLEKYFPDMVDTHFTSQLEHQLDEIAAGNKDLVEYLTTYFKGENGLQSRVEHQESQIDPQTARKIDLPLEGLGDMDIFVGRFGPYVQQQNGEDAVSGSLPAQMLPSDITKEKLEQIIQESKEGPKSLGTDPESGMPIYVLSGRFGPYVQVGDNDQEGKPKRASLLKGMTQEDVTLQVALDLLSLPRQLGKHPETEKVVKAGVGRFGPYVVHDGTFASLSKEDNVLTVDLTRALDLLEKAAQKKSRGSSSLKELGVHPDSGDEMKVMEGRYGPYIKMGKKNVSLPKDIDPMQLSLEEAVELANAKFGSAKAPKKKATAKKKTAAKTTTKKSTAKRKGTNT